MKQKPSHEGFFNDLKVPKVLKVLKVLNVLKVSKVLKVECSLQPRHLLHSFHRA